MDLAQVILYAGWIFFGAWGLVLAAISVIAFGRDIRALAEQTKTEHHRPLN